MGSDEQLQSRTKKSRVSIVLIALIPLFGLMAMWAALPEARSTVPVTWPLLAGVAWGGFWLVLGMADRYMRGVLR